MRKKGLILLCCLMPFLMIACGDPEENAAKLEIDFTWPPPCTNGAISPEIQLESVPEGTKLFYIKLTDLDLKTYDHGGGYAPCDGSLVIPPGAAKGTYMGPGPPQGVIHDYEIKVTAMDENKKVLGVGRKIHRYPPEGEEEVRWKPCD